MSVEANGTTPFTYEWSKDFVVIPGATAAQYEIASADLLDAGVYSVRSLMRTAKLKVCRCIWTSGMHPPLSLSL